MSTKKHDDLSEQIKAKADECGVTAADLESAPATPESSGPVGAPDGARLKKLWDFFLKIAPLIIPIFSETESATKKTPPKGP